MKKIITYIILTILFASCKVQQFDIASMSGRYVGVERAKNALSTSILLDLKKDSTCLFERSMDLSKNICQGKWDIVNNCVINITCNNNPILSDIEKALQCGDYIDDSLQIKILNKDKLKTGNVILKRKKNRWDRFLIP